jgi:hypothetical protein
MSEIPGVDPCECEGCIMMVSVNGGAAAPAHSNAGAGAMDIALASFRQAGNPQNVIANVSLSFQFGAGSCDETNSCAPLTPCNLRDVKLKIDWNGQQFGAPIYVRLTVTRGAHSTEPIDRQLGDPGSIVTLPVKLLPGSTGAGTEADPSSHDLPCGSDGYSFRVRVTSFDPDVGGANSQEQTVSVACSPCKVKPS